MKPTERRAGGLLSIVVPAMNEADNIPALLRAVSTALAPQKIPYEMILVDDGSADQTWQVICAAAAADGRVRGLKLSRNFGKEGAMFAGIEDARGDCCVISDADLQFPPATIAEMYAVWQSGEADIVEAKKRTRGKEGLVYKLFTKAFYGLLRAMSGYDLNNASDFKLMDRRVVETLKTMPERQTFFRGMSSWVGYRTETVLFDVAQRNAGKSKFSPKKLVRMALSSIASFTSAPLQFITGTGVVCALLSVALGLFTIFHTFAREGVEMLCAGLSVVGFLLSLIMAALGILGYYAARIYEELKNRPRYIVSARTASGDHAPQAAKE